uniref:Putative secreted protein n=1 Tax=Ixodes scapularis TaxID=6945 RepID=A0A4D5RAQ0_IXOSC
MVFLSTRALSFCFLICALLCFGAISVCHVWNLFFCLQSVRYGARVTSYGSRENGADFKIWEEKKRGSLDVCFLGRADRRLGTCSLGMGFRLHREVTHTTR